VLSLVETVSFEGERRMKGSSMAKLCVLLALLFVIGTLDIPPASSELPIRHFLPQEGAAGVATLYVPPQCNNFTSAAPIFPRVNTTFTVSVRIANATHIACWQVELWYNSNYLYTNTSLIEYASDMIFPQGTYSPIAPTINSHNSTHNYVLMTASTLRAAEYNATDAGIMTITFQITADPDPPDEVLSTLLYLAHTPEANFGTYALDTNINDNELFLLDGYYENKYAPLIGDVNQDAKVDGRDIARIAKYYGSIYSPPPYLPEDLNSDGKIEGRDIAIVSKHFGETYG